MLPWVKVRQNDSICYYIKYIPSVRRNKKKDVTKTAPFFNKKRQIPLISIKAAMTSEIKGDLWMLSPNLISWTWSPLNKNGNIRCLDCPYRQITHWEDKRQKRVSQERFHLLTKKKPLWTLEFVSCLTFLSPCLLSVRYALQRRFFTLGNFYYRTFRQMPERAWLLWKNLTNSIVKACFKVLRDFLLSKFIWTSQIVSCVSNLMSGNSTRRKSKIILISSSIIKSESEHSIATQQCPLLCTDRWMHFVPSIQQGFF